MPSSKEEIRHNLHFIIYLHIYSTYLLSAFRKRGFGTATLGVGLYDCGSGNIFLISKLGVGSGDHDVSWTLNACWYLVDFQVFALVLDRKFDRSLYQSSKKYGVERGLVVYLRIERLGVCESTGECD